ncbi:MAG: lipocalin family protein [Wenzhouxiangellaceae bacterium]|nr:lipocalin family protein [Wenzhouxiangellaceae bacterium]
MRPELLIGASAVLMMTSVFWPVRLLGADEPLDLVDSVDLERYQGLWNEIARLPNRFQDQCASNVTAEYTLLDNGRVKVVNRCLLPDGAIDEAEGVARRPDPAREAALKVRFAPRWLSWLPLVWGDYQIMALAEDYDWVLIGAPSREYLWILARQPTLPEPRLEALLEEAARQGFDTGAVIRTRQDG